MRLTDTQHRILTALVIATVVLSVAAPVAVLAETFLASFYTTESPIHFQTDNGCEVITQKNYNLQSGNPFTATSFNLSTESNGWLNISTAGNCTVTVNEINGTWTNVSSVSADSDQNVTLQPSDKNFTRVGDGVNTFKFRDIKVNDTTTDFRYTATSTTTIIVETNATDGVAYGLIDPDTNEGIDVAVANADGTIHFTEVPSSNTEQAVRIAELGTLTIREESTPHDLVTGGDYEITFYEDEESAPTIIQRSDDDSDGQIDLTGLPVDEEFSISITNLTNHHNRTVVLNDLSQQETVFLLNTSEPSIENRFTVSDRTGEFPSEDTEIIIQKAINHSIFDSGGFQWTNIAGDDLGADEAFTTDLRLDDRYRIKVQNDNGDSRILGAYTAATAGTINLIIGRVTLDPEGTPQPAWSANRTNVTGQSVQVNFEYNDSEQNTTRIWLHIYEYNNESNELLSNTSFTPSGDNFGTFSNTQSVSNNENDTTWVVDFYAERDGESDVDGSHIVGPQEDVLSSMPEWLLTVIFTGSLLIVAGLFSQLNGHVGGLVISGLGAVFWFSGFAPSYLGAGVVALSLIVAGVLFVNEQRGGF